MTAAVGAASLPAAGVATQWQDCPPSVAHGTFSYVACGIGSSALAMAVTAASAKSTSGSGLWCHLDLSFETPLSQQSKLSKCTRDSIGKGQVSIAKSSTYFKNLYLLKNGN